MGAVALWRILGSCCCCLVGYCLVAFLPGAAVVVALVLLGAVLGPFWGVCFNPLLVFDFLVLVGSSGSCPQSQN